MKRITLLLSLLCLCLPLRTYAAPSVDINHADAKQIAKHMKGVGPKRAQAIIDYRKLHGRFHQLSELTRVKGISQKAFKRYSSQWQQQLKFS